MKKISGIFLILAQTISHAQSFSPAEHSLIEAENNFAAISKKQNTRDAFLANLSDSVILFDKGKPVIGKRSWLERKADSSLLFWWPVFVGVSGDENTGFSIGPWEWSKTRLDKPQAFGYYVTVWQRPENGQWKVAADIGISTPAQEKEAPLKASSVSRTDAQKSNTDKNELFALDNNYLSLLNKNSVSFIPSYFANDGHLFRHDQPVYDSPDKFDSIRETNTMFHFTLFGGGLAASNDLGYTYGIVTIKTPAENTGNNVNNSNIRQSCFLRIWKKGSSGWKIISDLITRGQ